MFLLSCTHTWQKKKKVQKNVWEKKKDFFNNWTEWQLESIHISTDFQNGTKAVCNLVQTCTAWRQHWCNKVLLSFHQFHVIKRNDLTMMWATNYKVNVAVITNSTKFNLYLLRMRQERRCFYNYLNDPEPCWKDCNNYDQNQSVFPFANENHI